MVVSGEEVEGFPPPQETHQLTLSLLEQFVDGALKEA